MSRLTWSKDGIPSLIDCGYLKCKEVCQNHKQCSDCPIQSAINKLSVYEDAEEKGFIRKTDPNITPIIKGKLLILQSDTLLHPKDIERIRADIMWQIAEGVLIIPNGFSYEYLNLQQEGEE
jgi:hypothetical protein